MSGTFSAIVRRDLVLAVRSGGGLSAALGFMLAVVVMVPLALGPELSLLQRLAPGMMWLSLLLSVLLTAERIFAQDLEDGTIELMVAEDVWLVVFAFAKTLAHWLTVSLPLALISPFVGLMLNLSAAQFWQMMVAMVMGSLALSFVASIGGAVAAGLKRGGLLITLLVLPLYVPVLIFGISACQSVSTPEAVRASFLVLGGIVLLSVVLSPWAAAVALRAYLR